VSTIRDPDTGVIHSDTHRVLVQALREHGFRGKVAVTSGVDPEAACSLGDAVDLVLEPFQDAADRAAELLTSGGRPCRFKVVEPDEQKAIGQ